MQMAVIASRQIDAPVRAVWAVLADLPRWPHWDPYIAGMRRLDFPEAAGAPHWQIGARWREQVQRGPFRPVFRLTVCRVEEERELAWETHFLFVHVVHHWRLQPHLTADNTGRIANTCCIESEERFVGPAPMILAARVLFAIFRVPQMTRRSLAALALAAEAGRSTEQ